MDTAFPAAVHAVDKAWQEAAADCHQEYPELAYSTIQIIPAKDDTLGLDVGALCCWHPDIIGHKFLCIQVLLWYIAYNPR